MNELAKLKPIKPNVPINTFHFNWWMVLVIVMFLFLGIIIIFLKKSLKIKKEKKELFKLINNPKKFAYEFTKKAKKFKNKKNEKLLEEILNRLSNYKYKKEVEQIDEQTKKLVKNYLGIK